MYFQLSIQNSLNNIITTNDLQIQEVKKGVNLIKFRINNHNLPCGTYFVRLKIGIPGFQETYHRCIKFEIPIVGFQDDWIIQGKDILGTLPDIEYDIISVGTSD